MSWDWQFVRQILPSLLDGVAITVQISLLAYGVALVLGLCIAMLRRSKSGAVNTVGFWWVEGIRRTPLLVQLYFLFFVLPGVGVTLSPVVTGILGLGLNYSAYVSEVFRAGIGNVPRTQWEAALACNFSASQTWRHVILPQALPPMIPPLANYLISIFKETPILAMISVMELMNHAKVEANLTYRYLEPMTLVGVFFVLVSLPSMALTRLLERRLSRRVAR